MAKPFTLKYPLIHAAMTRWDRYTACGLPRRADYSGGRNRCSSLIARVTCVNCQRIVGPPEDDGRDLIQLGDYHYYNRRD